MNVTELLMKADKADALALAYYQANEESLAIFWKNAANGFRAKAMKMKVVTNG